MRPALVLVLVAGCVEPDTSVVFTGRARRFVVDHITLPSSNSEAREYGLDLNFDRTVDNQLGMVVSTLAQQGDITTHGADMIAAGAIASSVVVRSDDDDNDPTVAVNYFGMDGAASTHVGGQLEDGEFTSGAGAATSEPGSATVVLPVIADAAPAELPLTGVFARMLPDGDGFGAVFAGGVAAPIGVEMAYQGIVQMVAADPDSHRLLLDLLDTNRDYRLSRDEFTMNSLIASLLSPDVTIDGVPSLSFGFAVHLSPCDAGNCALGTPADPCHDGVLDGAESGVDCGGSCRSCKSGEACRTAADCESNACDGGTCRAPQCNDGVRDGFETDVDCGGPCGGCAIAYRCWSGHDCESGQCGYPCPPGSTNCWKWPAFDICRPAP